jgi:hypothetical protein
MPLLGMPILSSSVSISLGRDVGLDGFSTLGEDPLGLLDPRAGRRADMQPDLAGIDGGEEILADQPEGHQAERGLAASTDEYGQNRPEPCPRPQAQQVRR